MKAREIFLAGQRIASGRRPVLSIEITRECPLRCPGCYAYEDAHLGGGVTLRQLTDRKGNDLVDSVLDLVAEYRPLQLYLVGGDPLVRYRELNVLLPRLGEMGVGVQVITSAFRPIPESWAGIPGLKLIVSVDGLQPEHDERRKPATYDRILRNIVGHRVAVHCTITGPMMKRPGYLEEFIAFWSRLEEVHAVRMSMFTPQRGDDSPECLTFEERDRAIDELVRLRDKYPKLDMGKKLIRAFARPPASPQDCLFAQITETISADFKTRILPCQFGGDPDCARCGCMASVGLEAVAHYKLAGLVPVRTLFKATAGIGKAVSRMRPANGLH